MLTTLWMGIFSWPLYIDIVRKVAAQKSYICSPRKHQHSFEHLECISMLSVFIRCPFPVVKVSKIINHDHIPKQLCIFFSNFLLFYPSSEEHEKCFAIEHAFQDRSLPIQVSFKPNETFVIRWFFPYFTLTKIAEGL